MKNSDKSPKPYYSRLSDLDVILDNEKESDDFALPSEVECSKCGYPFLSHSSNPFNLVCQPCKRPWRQNKGENASKQYNFSSKSYKSK